MPGTEAMKAVVVIGSVADKRRYSLESSGTTTQRTPSTEDLTAMRRYSIMPCEPRDFLIDVDRTWKQILEQEDTDHDCKITIMDNGPKVISLGTLNSSGTKSINVHGTYSLSILLQELALARDRGQRRIVLKANTLQENPVDRLSRLIANMFWDNLVRCVDQEGIEKAMLDPKNHMADHTPRLYVPYHDTLGFRYYTKMAARISKAMQVIRLPEHVTPDFVKSIDMIPGILSLALRPREGMGPVVPEDVPDDQLLNTFEGVPFIVPGGRFNEMYGWDSYFESLGLLSDGKVELAKCMVDNFIYEIKYYGKILNANRSYYLTRSQPPFLTDMALQVFRMLPDDEPQMNLLWLAEAIRMAVREYFNVWMSAPRYVPEFGLSRYCDEGKGMPPETESGHFNAIMRSFARARKMDLEDFKTMYVAGEVHEPELDEYFIHDRSVRESGHDTSYRIESRSAHLLPIDLNALLYRYERDIAIVIKDYFDDQLVLDDGSIETSAVWLERAAKRQQLMDQYLWNEDFGMYFDYDFVHKSQTDYRSVTTIYPLWSQQVSADKARRIIENVERLFECPGGLVAGTEESRGEIHLERPNRQWDWPYGWAPHQMLAWEGLMAYCKPELARRLAYRWLFMITRAYIDFNGTVPEKFDVVLRTHQVEVEYGNVGTDFAYISREGFGWMNASYQLGLKLLTSAQRTALRSMVPPETLFNMKF